MLERLIKFNRSWNAKWSNTAKMYYVCCCEYLTTVDGKPKYNIHYLHRWITNATENEYVDHKDHDGMNNIKDNLRVTSNSNNNQHRKGVNSNSKTGVRNVNYIKGSNEYWVQLMKNGERFKWIFPAEQFEEAVKFAEMKRKELFGEFAGNG